MTLTRPDQDVLRTGQRPRPTDRSTGRGGRRERLGAATVGYAFLTPSIVLLGLFVFVPLGWAVAISLQQTNGFGSGVFVGLDNYQRLLSDPVFWRSAANTGLFTLIVVPVSMALGLGITVLMNSVLPARALFRTIMILPMVISGWRPR